MFPVIVISGVKKKTRTGTLSKKERKITYVY